MVEEKLRGLPEEYLFLIANYIDREIDVKSELAAYRTEKYASAD